jgi:hypothetical protein
MLVRLADPLSTCENPIMATHRIVYYHYYRHHKDHKQAYDVTEREQNEANAVAEMLSYEYGETVTPIVEHFEVVPESESRYMDLLERGERTIVVMQDMRMYAQTAGVRGLSLLRKSIDANIVPVTVREVTDVKHVPFDELWKRKADVIKPLTDHFESDKPLFTGRRRSPEITRLMIIALDEIRKGLVVDRHSLVDSLTSVVMSRFSDHTKSIAVFERSSWRTYRYKVRDNIEELIATTCNSHFGQEVRPSAVWSTQASRAERTVTVAAYVAEACIRELELELD